jgi:hypothetical protein
MGYKEKYPKCDYLLLQAWAHYLETTPWSAWCTFTYHIPINANSARKKMEQLFTIFRVKYGPESKMFFVAERFREGSYHTHALIKIDEAQAQLKRSILSAWHEVATPGGYKKYSRADIQVYQSGGGAHYYISKHLQRDNVEYGML